MFEVFSINLFALIIFMPLGIQVKFLKFQIVSDIIPYLVFTDYYGRIFVLKFMG
ncbi:MAG: hypothetical protein JWN56_1743 [Sphingobacteriales bacterium]|nr:hypothetical protein [Sphingobacteriales bacterium]